MRHPTPSRRAPAGEESTPTPAGPVDALPVLARKSRKLAKDVRSISTGYGRNPEKRLLQKDEVAVELEKLADMVSGGAR
jgi:hypothetical protein